MARCELLDNCGFFKAYQESKNLACKGFMSEYCMGDKMDQCRRKEYKMTHGIAPPDNMLPTGQWIVKKCDNRAECSFYQKYSESDDYKFLSLIRKYCKGRMMEECAIRGYFAVNGTAPPEEMLPTG